MYTVVISLLMQSQTCHTTNEDICNHRIMITVTCDHDYERHCISRAMEMNLTGTPITAQEASEWGLVSRVFPAASLVEEAVKTADKIASHSKIISQVRIISVLR